MTNFKLILTYTVFIMIVFIAINSAIILKFTDTKSTILIISVCIICLYIIVRIFRKLYAKIELNIDLLLYAGMYSIVENQLCYFILSKTYDFLPATICILLFMNIKFIFFSKSINKQ